MSLMAEQHGKKSGSRVFHPEFSRRMVQAADMNASVPPPNYGRLGWIKDQLASRFGVEVSTETVRKWFAGETKPRTTALSQLAQILGCDEAWLALGTAPKASVKEARVRNAAADGMVNLVAGLVQIGGGHPAFPTDDDKRAVLESIDLYAIIRGAQYAFHITSGQRTEGGWEFAVPYSALDTIIIGGVVASGFRVDLIEIDREGLAEHGMKRSGCIEVVTDEQFVTRDHCWRRIENFSERL